MMYCSSSDNNNHAIEKPKVKEEKLPRKCFYIYDTWISIMLLPELDIFQGVLNYNSIIIV